MLVVIACCLVRSEPGLEPSSNEPERFVISLRQHGYARPREGGSSDADAPLVPADGVETAPI